MSKLPTESGVDAGSPTAAQQRSPNWRRIPGGVMATLALLAFWVALTTWNGSGARSRPVHGSGLSASISIEPFATRDSALRSWNSYAFAEALAVQLAHIRGLETRLEVAGIKSDFTLRGDVSRRDGRLVIVARLDRATDTDSIVWTATYWRSENPGSALADDIAAGVAEALVMDLVRIDLNSKSKR